MKTLLNILTAVSAIVLLASCDKTNSVTYPSNLEGYWLYANSSTGYTGFLSIENIAGGQYASFFTLNPTKELVLASDGAFSYSSSTGKGTITSSLIGGATVTVQCAESTGSKLIVSATQIVSGGEEEVFSGTFSATATAQFTTGQWEGSYTEEGETVQLDMEVTSLTPKSDSCGSFVISRKTGDEEYTITSISNFIVVSGTMNYGCMTLKTGSKTVILMVAYDSASKDITMYAPTDGSTFDLKAVNIN